MNFQEGRVYIPKLGEERESQGQPPWGGDVQPRLRVARAGEVREKSYVIDWLCETCEKSFCPMLYLAMHFWREKRWLG